MVASIASRRRQRQVLVLVAVVHRRAPALQPVEAGQPAGRGLGQRVAHRRVGGIRKAREQCVVDRQGVGLALQQHHQCIGLVEVGAGDHALDLGAGVGREGLHQRPCRHRPRAGTAGARANGPRARTVLSPRSCVGPRQGPSRSARRAHRPRRQSEASSTSAIGDLDPRGLSGFLQSRTRMRGGRLRLEDVAAQVHGVRDGAAQGRMSSAPRASGPARARARAPGHRHGLPGIARARWRHALQVRV